MASILSGGKVNKNLPISYFLKSAGLIIIVITIAVLSGGFSSGKKNKNEKDVPYYLDYQGMFTERYVTGPMPGKDAILVLDPKYSPNSPYLELKQLPVAMSDKQVYSPHQHSYPELIGWFSTNKDNQKELGCVVKVYIGGEMHAFSKPTVLWVPANVPHGPVIYGKMVEPIMYIDMYSNKDNAKVVDSKNVLNKIKEMTVVTEGKYGKYFISGGRMMGGMSGGMMGGMKPDSSMMRKMMGGMKPDSSMMRGMMGGMPPALGKQGPMPSGKSGGMSMLSQVMVMPGSIPGEPNLPFFIYTWEDPSMSGTAMHNPHAHPYNEIMVYFSTDPNDSGNLGATYSFYTGKDMGKCTFSKPFISSSAAYKDLHAPLLRNEMTRSVGFIGISWGVKPGANPNECQYHLDLLEKIPEKDRPVGFAGTLLSTPAQMKCTDCHGKYIDALN
jgi:hypothetical protein